jgi:3-hydroxyacyl-CoA dehydrogenase/enoyl-CoA hydratase/3-hydroxybutyryl-CoA epimerase
VAERLDVSEMSAASESAVRWERDDDGIVTLILDDPARSANTMSDV